ncbi:hypothetical protein [Streptomyces sp. NPDC055210]
MVTMTSRVHAWGRVSRLPIITVRSSITATFWGMTLTGTIVWTTAPRFAMRLWLPWRAWNWSCRRG